MPVTNIRTVTTFAHKEHYQEEQRASLEATDQRRMRLEAQLRPLALQQQIITHSVLHLNQGAPLANQQLWEPNQIRLELQPLDNRHNQLLLHLLASHQHWVPQHQPSGRPVRWERNQILSGRQQQEGHLANQLPPQPLGNLHSRRALLVNQHS